MIQTDLHTPPLICCLRWKLTTSSPSGRAFCKLGLKPKYMKEKRCKGCTGNVGEQIQRGFQEGLERGKRLPNVYDQLKAYIDEEHPPEAYKTEEEEKVDIHEPLQRNIWETEVEFVERVGNKLVEGKLTPNAARKSVGLQPIDHKRKIYELLLNSGILCDECGPNSPTYCAEALADLLVNNGYRQTEDAET